MGDAARTSIIEALNFAHGHNQQLLASELQKLSETIFLNGSDEDAPSPIRFSALARLLLYVGLSIGEQTRGGTAGLKPSWKALIDEYEGLCKAVPADLMTVLTTDVLSGFCGFSSRRTGSHRKRIYVDLAILAVYLEERGLLKGPFLRMATPTSEFSLPRDIRDQLEMIFARCRPRDSLPEAAPKEAGEDKPRRPQIAVRFYYDPERLADFEEYRGLFAHPKDKQAHFVTYRPSRSDPKRLMKSYLAIGPASQEVEGDPEDAFRFVHVYEPPEDGAGKTQRLSLGRVIPLEDGVYMVGGQRDEGARRQPFRTLKTIALPWYALRHKSTLLNALVMSANHKGKHIITRAALRATPIAHSSHIKLGAVALSDLEDDLKADALVERAAYEEAVANDPSLAETWPERFPLCGDTAEAGFFEDRASRILALCNNTPLDGGWDVDTAFEPVKRGKKNDGLLTKNVINFALEREFGSHNSVKYVRSPSGAPRPQGEPFDFWSSIRFGPLTHD